MKVIGNLKIQNDGHPPYWIFAIAVHAIVYLKLNFEENSEN